ncbi:hypothetical protein J4731_04245 [Providencia rettgeri]|nr:hypothetical protein [Providencia rettgeri]
MSEEHSFQASRLVAKGAMDIAAKAGISTPKPWKKAVTSEEYKRNAIDGRFVLRKRK